MLIRAGAERTWNINLALAGLLSVIAGGLNAVGFLVAGSFTANMTGNMSLFAEHMAKLELLLALSFMGLAVAFIGGACAAAFAIRLGERRRGIPIYALVIVAEAIILLILALVMLAGNSDAGEVFLVTVLSFVMGLQNAVTTMISGAQVRTTHVSGMATDIGIELADMVVRHPNSDQAFRKLKLHSLTLSGFLLGGILGAVLYGAIGNWFFVLAGVALLVVSTSEIVRANLA